MEFITYGQYLKSNKWTVLFVWLQSQSYVFCRYIEKTKSFFAKCRLNVYFQRPYYCNLFCTYTVYRFKPVSICLISIIWYAFYHILLQNKLHPKHKYAAEYIQVPLRCFRMCFCILSRCRQKKSLSNAYYWKILNWKVPRKLRKNSDGHLLCIALAKTHYIYVVDQSVRLRL